MTTTNDAAERLRRLRGGESLAQVYDEIHGDHIGVRNADERIVIDAYLAQHTTPSPTPAQQVDYAQACRELLSLHGEDGSDYLAKDANADRYLMWVDLADMSAKLAEIVGAERERDCVKLTDKEHIWLDDLLAILNQAKDVCGNTCVSFECLCYGSSSLWHQTHRENFRKVDRKPESLSRWVLDNSSDRCVRKDFPEQVLEILQQLTAERDRLREENKDLRDSLFNLVALSNERSDKTQLEQSCLRVARQLLYAPPATKEDQSQCEIIPPREPEPITEEALRAIGFKMDDSGLHLWINAGWNNGTCDVRWLVRPRCIELANASQRKFRIPEIQTMPALMSLLTALGIQRKDGQS